MKKIIITTALVLLASTTPVLAKGKDIDSQASKDRSNIIQVNQKELIEDKSELSLNQENDSNAVKEESTIGSVNRNKTDRVRRKRNQLECGQGLQVREGRAKEGPRYQGYYRDKDCPNYVEGQNPRNHAQLAGAKHPNCR